MNEEQLRDYIAAKYNGNAERYQKEAKDRQRGIAADNQERRSMDGLGRPVMEVDQRVYQEWTQKEGKEIWKDKGFQKYITGKNPELVVKTKGTGKVQVGYGS